MSDDPSRYIFGIEKPLPWLLAVVVIGMPAVIITFAVVLGIWWYI